MSGLEDSLPVGLRGIASIAPHPATPEIQSRLRFTVSNAGTMVVAGPRGSGKGVALKAALQAQSLPFTIVTMPPAPSENRLMSLLVDAVLGDREDYDLRDMQDDLVETLSKESSILVIDQAQELTTKAASQLQYLHSRPGAPWSLLLVGCETVDHASTTSARLRGDIITTAEVNPLKGDHLLDALRAIHACFSISDPKLLKAIDHDYCHGLLGRWILFLQHALHLADAARADAPTPEITLQLARAATALMPPTARRRT